MEVAPGIHRIELEYAPAGLAIYALLGERLVLVDAGYAGAAAQIDAYLRRCGRSLADVDACVITHAHADHVGGSAEIKVAAPASAFCVHRDDKVWVEDPGALIVDGYYWAEAFGLPLPEAVITRVRGMLGPGVRVNILLREGDTVDLGGGWHVQVMHVPGHTRGHMALLDTRSNSLLAADAVLEPGVFPPSYFDALVYLETQKKILATGAARLLGCHYPVKEGQAVREFVVGAIQNAEECHRIVREALTRAGGPVQLSAVAGALLDRFHFGEIPQRWAWAAYGHLVALERLGEAVRRWNGLPGWELRQ